MLFYISMNLGTFACIVLFGLRTGTDKIRDYAGLYTKDPFLALSLALSLFLSRPLSLDIGVGKALSLGCFCIMTIGGCRSLVTKGNHQGEYLALKCIQKKGAT